jgi:hypothetical protein
MRTNLAAFVMTSSTAAVFCLLLLVLVLIEAR